MTRSRIADAVVVATPPRWRSDIVPAACSPSEIGGRGQSPIVNVHLVLDRPVTDLAVWQRSWIRRSSSSSIAPPRAGWPLRSVSVELSLSAAEDLDIRCRQPTSTSARQLGVRHASFAPPCTRGFCPWPGRHVCSTGSVDPRAAATFRAARARPRSDPGPRSDQPRSVPGGRVVRTGWPATMEGAVHSGQHAPPPTGDTGPTPGPHRPQTRASGARDHLRPSPNVERGRLGHPDRPPAIVAPALEPRSAG